MKLDKKGGKMMAEVIRLSKSYKEKYLEKLANIFLIEKRVILEPYFVVQSILNLCEEEDESGVVFLKGVFRLNCFLPFDIKTKGKQREEFKDWLFYVFNLASLEKSQLEFFYSLEVYFINWYKGKKRSRRNTCYKICKLAEEVIKQLRGDIYNPELTRAISTSYHC